MNFLESALREEARKLVACLRGKGKRSFVSNLGAGFGLTITGTYTNSEVVTMGEQVMETMSNDQKTRMKNALSRFVLAHEPELRQKYEDYAWGAITEDVFLHGLESEKNAVLYEVAKETGIPTTIPSVEKIHLPSLPLAGRRSKVKWFIVKFFIFLLYLAIGSVALIFLMESFPSVFAFLWFCNIMFQQYSFLLPILPLLFPTFSLLARQRKVRNCAMAFVRAFESTCAADIDRL